MTFSMRAARKVAVSPSSGLWVLEIQIRHPTLPISAFYEDLMLDKQA